MFFIPAKEISEEGAPVCPLALLLQIFLCVGNVLHPGESLCEHSLLMVLFIRVLITPTNREADVVEESVFHNILCLALAQQNSTLVSGKVLCGGQQTLSIQCRGGNLSGKRFELRAAENWAGAPLP